MNSTAVRSASFSRRRALSVAGGAAMAAAGYVRQTHAQVTPTASPVAGQPPAGTPVAGTSVPAMPPISATLAADASPEFRAVVDALVEAMQAHQVPGAAIGLLAGGREEHATVGVASVSSLRPVTPETLFQIGSLSKTFTATAIWHLIGEGALELDVPVRTYLPELTLMDESVVDQVTVANLLDHSAGFYGDEGFDTGNDDDAIERYITERLPQLPQTFAPGEFFSYNNAAFTILGRLIEVTTGTTYNAAIENLVFGPLGLSSTLLDYDDVRARPYADGHMALPINGRPSLVVQTPLWVPRSVDPAGGIWSTTRDVIRYARFHIGAGTVAGPANLVSPEYLAQMQEPAMPIVGTSMHMGRDWFVQDEDGTRVIFHGGDTLGQHTDCFIIPEQDFALVVLTNGQGGGGVATVAALNAAFAQIPALSSLVGKIGLVQSLIVPPDQPTLTLTPDELDEYEGQFGDPGMVITFVQTDNGLEGHTEPITQPGAWQPAIQPPDGPPSTITFIARDMGVSHGALLPFVRDADGRVAWVSAGLRFIPRIGDA